MVDLLWHSAAPWDVSGYGQQTALVVRDLVRRGLSIELSVPGGEGRWFEGIRCWDGGSLGSDDLTRNVARSFGGRPGRAVAFIDYVRLAKGRLGSVDLLYWYPFNFDPPPPVAVHYLRSGPHRVASLSKWGSQALAAVGVSAIHLPCATDTGLFRPITGDERKAMRQDVGIPEDAFVVGVVAVNSEWETNRKSLPEVLLAFGRFREHHGDAFLFMHSDVSGETHNGFRLAAVADSLDIPIGSVVAPSEVQIRNGIRTEDMPLVYGMFDVLLAPSAGEGFGLPVIEAQACGVPVIATDFTSLTELVGSGWLVGGQRRWSHYGMSWLLTPSVDELVARLEHAYQERRYPCPRAIDFAANFAVERVVDRHWMPLIERWLHP